MLTIKGEIQRLLAEMDGLFAELKAWLTARYDPLSGEFHYARSSQNMERRQKDAERTDNDAD